MKNESMQFSSNLLKCKNVCAKLFFKCGNLPETEEPVINSASFLWKRIPCAYAPLPPSRSGVSIYWRSSFALFFFFSRLQFGIITLGCCPWLFLSCNSRLRTENSKPNRMLSEIYFSVSHIFSDFYITIILNFCFSWCCIRPETSYGGLSFDYNTLGISHLRKAK